ncbi:MAG TPA: HAMP domain-containing sensor histidine kinase [Bacteroidota bacterium]|nr:HAMP domain-containing sensor histidine kinase [Bacteroidota bacterium]
MKKNNKNQKSPAQNGRKIAVIFFLIALSPAIIYSTYELSSLSSTEKLIQSIYNKQLDVILFSINQYALDVAQSWSGEINALLAAPQQIDAETKQFLKKRPAVKAVFYADSTGRALSFVMQTVPKNHEEGLAKFSLQDQSATMEKLLRYASSGYRKIEPVIIGDSASNHELVLLFVTASRSPRQKIAGFVIDTKLFLTEVLRTKIEQAAGEEFLLGVLDLRNRSILLSTAPAGIGDLRETKDLWLFPGYSIGIRLRGTSVEDIVRERSERNLILIGLLDLLLIGSVWLVYRTLKKEMELVRLKGDFVSNVSHELRTPLSLIQMFSETLMMKRVPTEEKKQEYYETILQETERLTRLVNNILNFSRMEAGKKQYHFETVSLNEIVAGVMKTYASPLEHEGFAVLVQCAEHLPAVEADRETIAEALINILDNAVKYSPGEKNIRIATGCAGDQVYVEVEDHGIGIEKLHHKKIFETFYRVSTGLTHNIKGSGLGLSLVSHSMNAHGGLIELNSMPGSGSTFRLLFPIVHRPNSTDQG